MELPGAEGWGVEVRAWRETILKIQRALNGVDDYYHTCLLMHLHSLRGRALERANCNSKCFFHG